MRRLFLGRKAQSITEYAIMVSIVIGALIAMQTYVKQSLSAKIKLAADGIHADHEYLYQPKTTTTKNVMVQRTGQRTHTIDENEIEIIGEGTGSDVLEDWQETKFQALELENAGE